MGWAAFLSVCRTEARYSFQAFSGIGAEPAKDQSRFNVNQTF